MSFVNVDGSIAYTLRVCQQTLVRLYDHLEHSLQDVDHISELPRCGDTVGRLSMWDSETGAGLGRLDHGLRKSSLLREGTEELLQELSTIGDEALSLVQGVNQDGTDDGSKAHECSAATNLDDSTSSEPGSSLSLSSTDGSSPLHQKITEMHDILDCLLRQVPALQDPAPHDTRTKDDYEGAYSVDLSHLKSKYPKASEELLNRLAVANWKRRRQLMSLKAPNEEKEIAVEPALNIGNSATSEDNDSINSDTVSEAEASQYSNINSTGLQSQLTGEWTTFSGNGSTMGTAITSMSGDPPLKMPNLDQPVERVDAHRLRLPRPPKPNSMLEGKQFNCPYCSFELVEVATLATWKEHVMGDLEPYLCTYGGCLRPAKTYGIRSDWIQHEIDVHQTQKVWLCRPCDKEFASRRTFDSHMREKHSEFTRKPQLDAFAEICQKTSGKLQDRTWCPLCLQEHHNGNRLRRHLADHLEQIALFAARPARPENDDDLDLMEDSGSDGENRAESVMLDTQEDSRTQIETRKAAVRKYVGDQVDPKIKDNSQASLEATAASQGLAFSQNSNVRFPVTTIVHPPNESFYGRDQDIQKLHKSLSIPGEICVIHGVGGIGKTLTAVEYAYRYKGEYDCVFWLQADTTPGLSESYGDIAHTLGLVEGNEDQAQVVELSRHWLDSIERRWLLIFDNVEDWDHVVQYLPQDFHHSHGSVIVTTQISSFATRVNHNLLLETFGEEDGSCMLLQYLDRRDPRSDERAVAQEISGLVGGLPVALSHVAGLAAYSECTLSELLEIFKQRRRHTGAATTEDDDLPASFRQASYSYDETLAMVWNVTLRELSGDARDLIYILAYLNCEAIPESMLCDVHTESFLEFLDCREMIRYKRMKRSLVKRRLIQEKKGEGELCLSLHRSLQRSIRETAAKDETILQKVFNQALILVRKAFPASSPIQVPDPSSWRGHQRLLPHVMSLQSAFVEAKSAIRGSKKFAGLLSDAGVNQWACGFTRDGLLLLTTAERVLDSVHTDMSNLMRADIHSFIALMHDNTGISTRAESLRRREVALDIRKKHTESLPHQASQVEETLLYNSWLDYAISLLQYNRYQEVEPILEKCLEKYREWGSPDEIPYEYAKYGHKMGLIRMYQGRYEEALVLCKQGVQHMEKTGNDSLMLRFKFDLACIYLQKGDIEQSLAVHKQVLSQRIPVCGKVNENTLQSYYAIGALEEIRGNFAEAEKHFWHALDRRRAAFWSIEAVARTQYHLAVVLRAQAKDLERATKNYDEAKATLARYLPLDCPDKLKDVKDEAVLFDHMLTVYGARFTGKGLLEIMR